MRCIITRPGNRKPINMHIITHWTCRYRGRRSRKSAEEAVALSLFVRDKLIQVVYCILPIPVRTLVGDIAQQQHCMEENSRFARWHYYY